ncbi:IS30 family transposase [Caldimonas brevitalea]|uniref:IS30 family transposase n=1 Tax=Caldimonas brevitalea TaxID=413882 RepID=UPI00063FE456|nr:IS30 family transposase [Caldimonas brevitalea]
MTRTYQQLGPEERGVIMAMTQQGSSARAIARALQRAPSTISRELRRNGHQPANGRALLGRPRLRPGYDAVHAGARARRVRRLSRPARKLHRGSALWREVRGLLQQCWSPQQIAGRLQQEYPGRPDLHASHETIYQAIYAMPRGSLRKELVALLRQGKGARKPRARGQDRRGSLTDIVSIHVRPPEADERLLPGHWEGDLIKGARNKSAVGTLVCRKTLFVMLVKIEGATALDALHGFELAFSPLDPELRKTLTYDQGKEMALHKKLAESTGLKIYFADPHSPWQRGICENTNGLLRQYLPKGTDLSGSSQRQLDAIAWSLNTRPRKTLGFRSPAEVFFEDCFQRNIDINPVVALGL